MWPKQEQCGPKRERCDTKQERCGSKQDTCSPKQERCDPKQERCVLIGAIPMCFHLNILIKFSQNTANFIVNYKCGDMFRLIEMSGQIFFEPCLRYIK